MKLRRILSVLVTVGLLSHALALVTHNAMALEAALNRVSLSDIICLNSDRSEAASAEAERLLADLPQTDQAKKQCPICLGLVMAHDFVAAEPFVLPIPVLIGTVDAVITEPAFRSFRLGWPPSRGPPSFSA